MGVRSKTMTGAKIEIEKVLDKSVTVLDYRIGDSKFNRNEYLTLQILFEGETRIIFTGSGVLKEDLEKLKRDDFPFQTTIVRIQFNEKQFFFKFT